MKPKIIEFKDETELLILVKELATKGIKKENMYVMAYDNHIKKELATKANISIIGFIEEGVETFVKNIFKSQTEKTQAILQKLGLDLTEARVIEEKLTEGKTLLLYKI